MTEDLSPAQSTFIYGNDCLSNISTAEPSKQILFTDCYASFRAFCICLVREWVRVDNSFAFQYFPRNFQNHPEPLFRHQDIWLPLAEHVH